MLITSSDKANKFHDYYDGIAKQYTDKTIVYDRTHKINDKSLIFKNELLTKYYKISSRLPEHSSRGETGVYKLFDVTPLLLCFCGKLYITFEVKDTYFKPGNADMEIKYLSSQDEVLEFINEYEFDSRRIYFARDSDFTSKNINDAYATIDRINCDDILIDNNAPVILFRGSLAGYTSGEVAIINPRLSDTGFIKIKEPFTCFQDIQTYISNVLVNNDNKNIVKIGNNDLIQSKGFDLKSSFRKESNSRKSKK